MVTIRRANIGCGMNPTDGWLNIDNSPSVFLANLPRFVTVLSGLAGILTKENKNFIAFARTHRISYQDVSKGLRFECNSLDAIYSSHMLEHMQFSQARFFLTEVFRSLRVDGVVRLVLPDLVKQVLAYQATQDADKFMHGLHVCLPSMTFAKRVGFILFGARHHQWMYDARSCGRLLTECGFKDIIVFPPGQTGIRDYGSLDLRERAEESFFIEGKKS